MQNEEDAGLQMSQAKDRHYSMDGSLIPAADEGWDNDSTQNASEWDLGENCCFCTGSGGNDGS